MAGRLCFRFSPGGPAAVYLGHQGGCGSAGRRRRSSDFCAGDVLETLDCVGQGQFIGTGEDQPFGGALIELDNDTRSEFGKPVRQPSKQLLPFLRNITGDDGQSHFEDGALPYSAADYEYQSTDNIAVNAFQFILSLGNLSFDFHNGPQRQIVLSLTGGIEGENGDGSHRQVRPGEIYFGEDTAGQGHITRALDGQVHISIFAHLA